MMKLKFDKHMKKKYLMTFLVVSGNEKTIIFISQKIDIINEYCDEIYIVGSKLRWKSCDFICNIFRWFYRFSFSRKII